ncbi:hypothetical protein F3157_00065 [Virgibacillus dakarensis]|uniref:Aminodeoxychorismate lyase n=1 Tax=Lentibacillus populi TaxID=1827502 RepID=A0A9W5TUT3_9BACI|nr:hypothetical protein [Lentibacillus populi]MTW84069.1 hypothetical protein [Virgibacillus dakarensis]GGB29287.1 hypothetical protein GCM10011409_03330 [Lentibacillus populi]
MKQPVRLFSLGLFTASLIVLILFLFVDDSKKNVENIPNDEMITALQADGYRVLSESEYISLSVNNDKDKQEAEKTEKASAEGQAEDNNSAEKADEDKENKADEAEKEEKTYTLTIKSGMASSEISDALVENGIIDDAGKFSKFLKDKGYDTKVQLGKFKVSSSMNQKEIAEEITK